MCLYWFIHVHIENDDTNATHPTGIGWTRLESSEASSALVAIRSVNCRGFTMNQLGLEDLRNKTATELQAGLYQKESQFRILLWRPMPHYWAQHIGQTGALPGALSCFCFFFLTLLFITWKLVIFPFKDHISLKKLPLSNSPALNIRQGTCISPLALPGAKKTLTT